MEKDLKGLGELVTALSKTNIQLWHEEDKARSEDDPQVAQAKRDIDKLNQQRNNLIEKIDDFFIRALQKGERKSNGRNHRKPC